MKAVVFTLGCKVNSCESATLVNGLMGMGYEVSTDLCRADLYIINTCAVTSEAEKKSRQTIARARKFNENAKIIVTGCAAEKNAEEFLNKNGVTLVTGTKSKDKILKLLDKTGKIFYEDDEYYEEYLPAKTTYTRAYVKVEDGCDNFCSYCIVPYLRGRVRSRNPENVVNEINYLSPVEAVITGINLSAYNYGGLRLGGLIGKLQSLNCRIRLGSLEVNIITDEFLKACAGLKDFAPHFHLSLQSGSTKVLREMNRHYTKEQFIEKCRLIRSYFPDAGITTDIIVGYSTETEEDFNETLDIVKKVEFSDIHCFPYSKREGTAGAKLKELSSEVKKDRLERLLKLKEECRSGFINRHIGKILEFLPEAYSGGFTNGYTENYIRVYVPEKTEDRLVKVRLNKIFKDGADAEIIK